MRFYCFIAVFDSSKVSKHQLIGRRGIINRLHDQSLVHCEELDKSCPDIQRSLLAILNSNAKLTVVLVMNSNEKVPVKDLITYGNDLEFKRNLLTDMKIMTPILLRVKTLIYFHVNR